MSLGDKRQTKLNEIVQFGSRINDAYRRLPYLEDLVEQGESELAEKISQVFEIYEESLLIIVRSVIDDTSGIGIADGIVDESYAKLFEAEKKLYQDVIEYILHDLEGRWVESRAKSEEAYRRLRKIKSRASTLIDATFTDVSRMSSDYNTLLADCDEVDALMVGAEAKNRSYRIWQLATGIAIATVGALVAKILGLW